MVARKLDLLAAHPVPREWVEIRREEHPGGTWVIYDERKPSPLDPSVQMNIQQQRRQCRGCGDEGLPGY